MAVRYGSPNRHGSRFGDLAVLCVRQNGMSTESSSHRRYSSGLGAPLKPPVSEPTYVMPESPRPIAVATC